MKFTQRTEPNSPKRSLCNRWLTKELCHIIQGVMNLIQFIQGVKDINIQFHNEILVFHYEISRRLFE